MYVFCLKLWSPKKKDGGSIRLSLARIFLGYDTKTTTITKPRQTNFQKKLNFYEPRDMTESESKAQRIREHLPLSDDWHPNQSASTANPIKKWAHTDSSYRHGQLLNDANYQGNTRQDTSGVQHYTILPAQDQNEVNICKATALTFPSWRPREIQLHCGWQDCSSSRN